MKVYVLRPPKCHLEQQVANNRIRVTFDAQFEMDQPLNHSADLGKYIQDIWTGVTDDLNDAIKRLGNLE